MTLLILPLLAVLSVQAEAPVGTNLSAIVVREVVTTWNSIGHLQMHDGKAYDVLQPQLFTNVIARATYKGKVTELMLESEGGPVSTNLCDFKLQPIALIPFPALTNRDWVNAPWNFTK